MFSHSSSADLYTLPPSLYTTSCVIEKPISIVDGSLSPFAREDKSPVVDVPSFDSQTSHEGQQQNYCDMDGCYPNTFFDDLFGSGEHNLGDQNLTLVKKNEINVTEECSFNNINNVLSAIDWEPEKSIDLGSVFTNLDEIDAGPTLATLNGLNEESLEDVIIDTRHAICTDRSQADLYPITNSAKYVGASGSSSKSQISSLSAGCHLEKTCNLITRQLQPLKPIHGGNFQNFQKLSWPTGKQLLNKKHTKETSTSKDDNASNLAQLLAQPLVSSIPPKTVLEHCDNTQVFSIPDATNEKLPCIGLNQETVSEDSRLKSDQLVAKEDSDKDNDSDNSSDTNDDTISDCGSLASQELVILPEQRSRKSKCFWEYNIHGKKKFKSLCILPETEDPHVLSQYVDPVFDSQLAPQVDGAVRHTGKARRGDGNDLTPNPAKLYRIGLQLQKINNEINSLHVTPVDELQSASKDLTRKQKNKLASRACRLKKKAQHEANKVKLYGLDREHEGLMQVLSTVKSAITKSVKAKHTKTGLAALLSDEIASNLVEMVAGNTMQYVNAALQRVENGDKRGGLTIANSR